MWISNTSIKQPVFTTMVIAALAVFGLVSYNRLGVDLFPKIDFPVITVTTLLPGADPETVESDVTERLEEALNTLSGIKSLRSQSSESVSLLVIEFELDRNVDAAAQDVRDKVSAIRRMLPADVEEPVIEKLDPDAAPIIAVALAGHVPVRDLTTYADEIVKERLERVSGVGSVEIVGGREREIRIWIHADRLAAYGLAVDSLLRALQAENLEVPGGRIETGMRELVVRTRGRIQRPEDFGAVLVAERSTGPIYVRDVAMVEDGVEDERSLSRLNGQRAVSLLIRRQSGTNAVAVAHAIKNALTELRPTLPQGFQMVIANDLSEFIEESVGEVRFHLAFGGLLAVLVIFFFLRNFRSTLISAVAIPTSVIGTFTFIDVFGFSLNLLTLLALSLSVGILIDDAIVVLENIFRHMEEGMPRQEAAEFATSEIGLAVMATTFSIVAVFVPVAFMQGMIGRFFYAFGITVACAVMISLFVSFTLTPMLSSRFLAIPARHGLVFRAVERALNGLDRRYRALLGWSLRHRWVVVTVGTAAFATSLWMLRLVGAEFIPQADESQFSVIVRTAPGTSLEATDRIVRQVEARLSRHPAVEDVFTAIGGGTQERVTEATVLARLVERDAREQTQQEIMNQVREDLKKTEHVRISVEPAQRISGGGFRAAQLQVNVRAPKTAALEELSSVTDRLVSEFRRTPGIVDLDTTYEGGKPQVSIRIDRRRAADLGVSAASVGSAIRLLVGGEGVTKFQEGGRQYDVRVRLAKTDRSDPSQVETLPLGTRSGRVVQLGNVATVLGDTGPTQIDHQARQRQITILANLEGKALGDAVQDVNAIVARAGLPGGFTVDFEGQAEIMAESFQILLVALALAVVLIYMVLASQFGSFVHPFTIMLSLPMSVVGAVGGLLVAGHTLSIFAMIGIIMLMGLVTKNAILLIDYTNTLRQRDRIERNEAVLRAGPVRLRPILMTTSAMVFGMLPVAVGLGTGGGEQRAPMAVAVIGGLITSTLLTLVLVPVVYTLLDDLTGLRLRAWIPAWRRAPVLPEPRLERRS
ncbi:MAG: efflux RND transporter permease subunit [Acidobacteria bacterium]|nr:efflux RND transporter permease subunit [Acidobacteriota bacterium]